MKHENISRATKIGELLQSIDKSTQILDSTKFKISLKLSGEINDREVSEWIENLELKEGTNVSIKEIIKKLVKAMLKDALQENKDKLLKELETL